MLYRLIAKFRKFFTTKFYAKASVRGEKGKEKYERVLMEHAAYKRFFDDVRNRPKDVHPGIKLDYIKARLLDCLDKVEGRSIVTVEK
jgi:hypothetical protein